MLTEDAWGFCGRPRLWECFREAWLPWTDGETMRLLAAGLMDRAVGSFADVPVISSPLGVDASDLAAVAEV